MNLAVDATAEVGPVERPWRPIIGSEHLGIYRESDGQPIHDFERVDAALERLLGTGLRPVVELSFMPRDLASDPERTVFDYRGIISPPRDMGRWSDLVAGFVHHVIDRFGRDEVRSWAFEVWNEPNLRVFWSGDEDAYFDLYDTTVRAVRAVDPTLRVGGPATAAVGWVDDLLAHAGKANVPLDFLSTHTYGLHRSTFVLSPPGSDDPTFRCGGPSGASHRPTARRSTTARGRHRWWPVACARRPVGSSPWRTGSRRTISSNSAKRSGSSTAGSACSRSATSESPASGRSRCLNGSGSTS